MLERMMMPPPTHQVGGYAQRGQGQIPRSAMTEEERFAPEFGHRPLE